MVVKLYIILNPAVLFEDLLPWVAFFSVLWVCICVLAFFVCWNAILLFCFFPLIITTLYGIWL